VSFPERPKPPHHKGRFRIESARVRAAAYANPDTRCWRCNNRLEDCRPHRNGKPAHWTAGHLIDGDINSPLLPECSSCNATAGAQLANQRSQVTKQRKQLNASRQW